MCMLENKVIKREFENGGEIKIDLRFQGIHDHEFSGEAFTIDSKHYYTLLRFSEIYFSSSFLYLKFLNVRPLILLRTNIF